MNGYRSTRLSYLVLVGLVILGGGVLVWLAPVTADRLTPAQNNLIVIADWMVKASIGAILGLIGGRRLANGKPAAPRNGTRQS